jgi:hypothetical protein
MLDVSMSLCRGRVPWVAVVAACAPEGAGGECEVSISSSVLTQFPPYNAFYLSREKCKIVAEAGAT